MIVFCPNCGTQNGGLPGARATCTKCAAPFDVPADAAARPPAEAPQPASFSAPGAQVFSPRPGAPIAQQRGGPKANTLAIVSLVAGIVCCFPFLSPGLAIGCGIGALKQIDASPSTEGGRGLAIAGIILGALTAMFQLLGMISSLGRRF